MDIAWTWHGHDNTRHDKAWAKHSSIVLASLLPKKGIIYGKRCVFRPFGNFGMCQPIGQYCNVWVNYNIEILQTYWKLQKKG